MRRSLRVILVLVLVAAFLPAQSTQVQFIFTADSHYGLTRPSFRGGINVDAHAVNAAMIAQINRLPGSSFPADGGIRSGQAIGPIDFLVDGGDIVNRAEKTAESIVQSAAASWSQFRTDYIDGLSLLDRTGKRIPAYVVPGNHDASNAIGSYKPMTPLTDATSMVQIYNLMVAPAIPKTTATYDYEKDKVLFSHDVAGVHFIFISIWPDSSVRQWLETDLKQVNAATPVIVFAHDPPDSDSKHFKNPNGKHDLNETDQFENLLADTFADEVEGVRSASNAPLIEQTALEKFFRQHTNIKVIFRASTKRSFPSRSQRWIWLQRR
jgi:predicted MPP superfamily phosphohydrolase